jgi:Protein of unknown function (DUF3021).
MLNKIKNVILVGCLYYTIVSILIYALSLLLTQHEMVPTFASLLMILAASISISALNGIFGAKKLPPLLRLVIHYVLTAVAFYLIFILSSGLYKREWMIIIYLAAFTIAYAIIAFVVFIIRKTISERNLAKKEYKNQFDNVNTK